MPQVEAAHASLDDSRDVAALDAAMGDVLLSLGQYGAASGRLERALTVYEAAGDRYHAARLAHALALAEEGLGHWERAVTLRAALDEASAASSSSLRYWNTLRLGTLYLHARHYARARHWLRQAETLSHELGEAGGLVQRALAELSWALGDLDGCERAAEVALAAPDARDMGQGVPWLLRGLVSVRRGQQAEAHAAFERAQDALTGTTLSYSQGRLLLARAELEGGAAALSLVEEARRLAESGGHAALLTDALATRAQALLRLGRPGEALTDSTLAVERLAGHPPREDHARPWLVHHEVMTALGCPDADVPLRQALGWLADMLPEHVPEDLRPAFLYQHATHRAVLEAAERTGLDLPFPAAPGVPAGDAPGALPAV